MNQPSEREEPQGGAAASQAGPRNDLEAGLAELWCRVLEVDAVSVDENFFDLGGDSVVATQLVSRVRETFHVELPVSAIFDAPTVSEMAVVIVQKQAEQANADALAQALLEIKQMSGGE